MTTTIRSQRLDILKGIAILAVIFYHSGLFTYGYLGVEIFLVIGGYVITKSILRSYDKEEFSYLVLCLSVLFDSGHYSFYAVSSL